MIKWRKTADARKRRGGTVPVATSTPQTREYDFTDGEVCARRQDETFTGRLTTQNLPVSNADILQRLDRMEKTLLGTIENLKKEVSEEKKQVTTLTERAVRLERQVQLTNEQQQQTASRVGKSRTDIRAALKAALDHAEKEKGLTLKVNYPLESLQNQELLKYAWDFARTLNLHIERMEFYAAANRIMASQREKVSRQLHGSDQRHRDTARKYARKVAKSRNRVSGVDSADLESHTKDRYKKALKKQQMMSSEDSSFDEDGNKFFRVRKRTWDSLELKKAKKIADTAANANPGKSKAEQRECVATSLQPNHQ